MPTIERPEILVVEPSAATRHAIAEVLRECGYIVYPVASAAEAASASDQLGRAPALALLQMRPRDTGALRLAEMLRTRWPSLFILYFSAIAPEEDDVLREALRATRTALLSKPTELDALVDAVREGVASSPSQA